MSKYFGKTWWGQQWLNSLANIDYSNRLPRGSAYARNGSVKKIAIEGNIIQAKVFGSRTHPYDIKIIVPPFSVPDTKRLIKALAEKPVIISKLLNRELDQEVLQIAERKGLHVFPTQWSDLKMKCSCPDWAVPCKHLAAIIYKVSAEIDNNPFMVFELHNVNLTKELQKEHIHIQPPKDGGVPMLIGELKAEDKNKLKKAPAKKQTIVQTDEAVYQSLNFSTLVPIADPVIQLLADNPAFYSGSGNFREKYALVMHKAVRNAQRIITGKAAFKDLFSEIKSVSAYAAKRKTITPLVINHHSCVHLLLNANNELNVAVDETKAGQSLEQLIVTLWQIPPAHLQDYQPSVAALRTALLLGINLVANGALVPQIVRLENKLYAVRWLPAMLSKEVKSLVEKLAVLLPEGLLRLQGQESITHQTAVHLLSVFISALADKFSEKVKEDVFLAMFFKGEKAAFDLPGQEALPGSINAWLQRYYLTQAKYKPSIIVEEEDDGFKVSITIEQRDKSLAEPVSLRNVTSMKKYEKLRYEILQSLSQLGSFIPSLDRYIDSQHEEHIVMDRAAFVPFLMQAIPAIRLLNINILLPKSLQHILKPKASVHIKQKAEASSGFMRLDTLLDFEWQVAIGDAVISEEEFTKLLKNSEGLIRYKTNYLYVSPADLEKLHKHFISSKDLSAFDMLRAALSNEYYGARISMSDDIKKIVRQLTEQPDVPLPDHLLAQLRPYQHRGYSWMYRNTQIGFGSVIADDMGLGKTLQVITTLLKYKQDGALQHQKALVVSPTGLLTNWQAEFEKFAPSLNCKLYHGLGRKLEEDEYDVLLTSYGVVRSDAVKLKKKKWHVLVIDEAQNIKNYEAEQSKAVKSIPAGTYIAMSGTPVENRLSELWSIMDFCNRGFLGSLPEFRQLYANPIQNQHDAEAASKLKIIAGPFLMRRLKSDKSIISDLPDKIEMDCFSHLTKEQASLYEKTLHKALQAIENIKTKDQRSLFERQGLVLQMILALKQICNHPTQFLKNNILKASLSGKVDLLFDKLESIVEANEKVLIFSQFTEMGNLLKHFITERFNEEPLFYHGGCSLKQRKEMVHAFQHNRANKIFLLSLKAAGTGLNLTAANHVIHYDLWWNPAVEAQATDRAYRIGQKSNVMVHRFITKGTFEERINDMIQSKKALADLTIAAGENWIGNLSNKELKEMFVLG